MGVFSTISNIYDETLTVCIFAEHSIKDIRQGAKYGCAVLFLNIFPLSLFGYFN